MKLTMNLPSERIAPKSRTSFLRLNGNANVFCMCATPEWFCMKRKAASGAFGVEFHAKQLSLFGNHLFIKIEGGKKGSTFVHVLFLLI